MKSLTIKIMEKELNIAAILKDKPKGTKLYDKLHNTYVKLDYISNLGVEIVIWAYDLSKKETFEFGYSELGTVRGYLDGLQILKPSKSMQDWSKFAWKKGDVLATDINTYCIFDSWENGDYTQFRAKYICRSSDCYFYSDEVKPTCDWTMVKENDIIEYYINIIERSKGGKLNLDTLEIEREPEQEFKDGDIVYVGNAYNQYLGIVKEIVSESNISTYVYRHKDSKEKSIIGRWINKNTSDEFRLATEEEMQQLFDALEKEGKRWNQDTKTLENLPKKCEFKPMDWCLMRDIRGIEAFGWSLCQYAYQLETGVYEAVGGLRYNQCIPYNDQTAHLLGTTDDWKGGE